MIVLTSLTDKIQVSLGGTVVANQLQCVSFWRDITPASFMPGRTVVLTNNTSDVNIVESVLESIPEIQRLVDYLSVYNSDTSNQTVTVKFDTGSSEFILWRDVLGTGEKLEYNDKSGFVVIAKGGGIKQSQVAGSNNPALNTLNLVVLGVDVVNNNAVANTIANVTGLSFDVTAGQTYYFEFTINYTAAAPATGSRWSITGPTFTRLDYTSEYTLTATTKTVNNLGAYDLPAASNATSLASGNICTIWGFITPSANGTVTARFASEVLSSAITAKAGSILRWVRTL
jgi:hypothetical protein